MNYYLRQLLIGVKSGSYHQTRKFNKQKIVKDNSANSPYNNISLLEKGIYMNKIVSKKLKMYSRNVLSGNGVNGDGRSRHKNPELQRLTYEIDKAEFAVDRAYKELQKAEQEVEYLRGILYYKLGIEDDFYLFNLGFLRGYGLTESLYKTILSYNNKVIEYVTKYKKYVIALNKYETALADYATRTEGPRAIDPKIREIKMAYREAEIQYADATIELRQALNKLLAAIKYLIDAEYKFMTMKNKLEKLDVLDEHASRLQDKVIDAFYEYQDSLRDYYNARKNVEDKVREYKEARMIYETMQQEYEEVLRDIMAN